jgi:LuxR family maltose regulon positive regulatory protein
MLQEFSDELRFLQNTQELAPFVLSSSFTNELKIHPLYLEFLQSKQTILSNEEKQEIYNKAAEWCSENGFFMDAMSYYAKLNQFEKMVKMLLSYPLKLPHDTSEYLLNILENLNPGSDGKSDFHILFLKNFFIPLLLVGAGRYKEARERAFEIIREWAQVDTSLSTVFLYTSYSSLAYIDMYICTSAHEYNSAEYLKKSVEHIKRSSVPPIEMAVAFVSADVRSFACLVGEGADLSNFDQFLETARQSAIYTVETNHQIYAGYDDLAECEYAFFKNQPVIARNHAHNAIIKAREQKQYSIAAMAENYLLGIAVQEGDHLLTKEIVKQMRSYLDNPDFWNRRLYHDLYIGAFYAKVGLPEMVPKRFIMDEREAMSEIHIPAREIYVSALHCIASKKYQQALEILRNSYPREPHERFLFGELRLLLLTVVARIRTDDITGATADFLKAYELSFNGVCEMFFIELGKELHPLIAAMLKCGNHSVPEEWLKTIDRKAAIYAKKTGVIANAFKEKTSGGEYGSLSEREREVLIDLYHGLSRDEIATNRYMSINTVKKMLQSIYTKLDAHNNVDAVRIALERKLVE